MPSDPDVEAQTPVNEGRFFATVGTGRPSEMREITDDRLQALNSPEFQVSDAMPDELKVLDDAEDWEEPEDRRDEADSDDEEEDDEED